MNIYEFEAGNHTYNLKLTTKNIIAIERKIGCNLLMIFGIDGDKIPTVETMVLILHASMQAYNHGITIDDATDIFDAWLNEGHAVTDFVSIIMEIYRVSGIIKDSEADNEKN